MKLVLLSFLLALYFMPVTAQDTSATWLLALPITDYIVPADSIQIVQVMLPPGISIAEKQAALLKGIYRDGKADTAAIGWGRCQLIKAPYYYFGMRLYDKKILPHKGDLIYTRINKTNAYFGRLAKLALQAITLQTVYEVNLYEPLKLLQRCTKLNEAAMMDSLVADTRLTGRAMKEQMPGGNRKIAAGKYKDKLLFDLMQQVQKEDIGFFLDYMIAKPALYAGNAWKLSEIFATWVDGGAPGVK